MLYYALCLSYHSITEAALFACLLSDWVTTMGRLLGPKVGNSIKCLSQGHSNALSHRELNQSFTTFRLLAQQLNHVAATIFEYDWVNIGNAFSVMHV